ncbi:MAG: MarR family transcriptional regulator [Bacteroidetes bacterium]|nr:MAG: MarR family transcriptional regulator [Bacteroidota bacterium]
MSDTYNTPEAPFCQIKKSWRRLQKLDQDLRQQADISLDEAIVLCCLSQRCKCQGNVAEETGLTTTQASRVLSKLEDKQLIERSIDAADKRKMIFTLSPSGHQTLEKITPLGVNHIAL